MRLLTTAAIAALVLVFPITFHAALPVPQTLPPADISTDQAALQGGIRLSTRAAARVTFQIRKAGRNQWRTQLPWQRLGRGETEVTFTRVAAHLAPGTQYDVRAIAMLGGVRRNGAITSFQSVSTNPVVTGAAEAVSATSTRLNGTIAAVGVDVPFHFAYGPTTDYGFTNAGTVTVASNRVPVQVTVIGFVAGATYHYKLVAGDAGSGEDATFMQGRIGPPCVLSIASDAITADSARLSACLNPKSFLDTAAYFEWGLDTSYGNPPVITAFPGGGVAPDTCDFSAHEMLTGLIPGTTYHYRVVVTNAAGVFGSVDATFTTPARPGPGAVVTGGAEVLSPTSARLTGTIEAAAGSEVPFYFAYGLTSHYGITAGGMVTITSSPAPAQVTVTGLVAGATYHYKLFAENGGVILSGEDATFTLSEISGPIVLSSGLNTLTSDSASLSACINPGSSFETIAYFEWGSTASYGNKGAVTRFPEGGVASDCRFGVQQMLVGLTPDTTYHFRVVASNQAGVTFSGDATFATLPAIKIVANVVLQRGHGALLRGSVNPGGIANTMAYFEWGPSGNYGQRSAPLRLPAANWPINIETAITGLATGVVYHYRLALSNAFGLYATDDQTFESFEPLQLFEGETWTYHFDSLPFERTSPSWYEPANGVVEFSVPAGGFSSNALLLIEMFETDANSPSLTNGYWSAWSTNSVTRLAGGWRDRAGAIRLRMLQGDTVISSLSVGASFLSGDDQFMDWYRFTFVPRLESGEYLPAQNAVAPATEPAGE